LPKYENILFNAVRDHKEKIQCMLLAKTRCNQIVSPMLSPIKYKQRVDDCVFAKLLWIL